MNAFEQKKQLLTFYDELISSGLFKNAEVDNLTQSREDLQSERFSIALLGRFNAGKSTLINKAFLGENILPSIMKPATARIVSIVDGDKNLLTLYDKQLGTATVLACDDVKSIRDKLEECGTHQGLERVNIRNSASTSSCLELQLKDNIILQEGVTLVDTVGTEDPRDGKQEISKKTVFSTYAEIEKASAVIIVLIAIQALTNSEQDVIETHLGHKGKKIFVVLNYADALNDAQKTEVHEDVSVRLHNLFQKNGIRSDGRILFTSGKEGAEEGLAELKQRVVEFISQDRVQEIVLQRSTFLRNKLQQQKESLSKQASEITAKIRGEEVQIRELHSTMRFSQEELSSKSKELNYDRDELIELGQRNLARRLSSQKRLLMNKVKVESFENMEGLFAKAIDDIRETYEDAVIDSRSKVQAKFSDITNKWNQEFDARELKATFQPPQFDFSAGKAAGATLAALGTGVAGYGAWTYATAGWFTLLTATPPGMVVAGTGLAIAALGSLLFARSRTEADDEARNKMISAVNDLYEKAEEGTKKDLEANITKYFDDALNALKAHLNNEEQRLDCLIKEKDREKLKQNLKELNQRQEEIDHFLDRLREISQIDATATHSKNLLFS